MKCAVEEEGCPYYAARKAIPYLQLVLLPYNLILNKKSREALGIDLKVGIWGLSSKESSSHI